MTHEQLEEGEVFERDKVFDCFEDGCSECTVCKYLDFLDWADSVGKPPNSTTQRNQIIDDYLRRKENAITTTAQRVRRETIEEVRQKIDDKKVGMSRLIDPWHITVSGIADLNSYNEGIDTALSTLNK